MLFSVIADVCKVELERTRKELKSLVDEFYHSVRQMCEVMRNKHRQELLELGRKKRDHNRKISNTTASD